MDRKTEITVTTCLQSIVSLRIRKYPLVEKKKSSKILKLKHKNLKEYFIVPKFSINRIICKVFEKVRLQKVERNYDFLGTNKKETVKRKK